MKKTGKFWILGLLSSSISLACHAAPITFDTAWQLLLENNYSLKAQRSNVENYQYQESATSNLNLPQVTIGANYTRLDTDITLSGKQILDSTESPISIPIPLPPAVVGAIANTTSTITERDIFSSSIRAIWPIFTGGRISAAQSAAEGKTDEAKSQLLMEQQARFEDLSKYYFSVVLAKEVLATRQAVEAGLKKHRDFAIKLEEQGQIAHVERLQAEASLDKASVETRKAASDLSIAQAALGKLLAQDDAVEPAESLFINDSLPPLTAFVDQTLLTYPGLDLLSAKHKQASSLIKAEKGKYYPEVYLYGDYSLYEDDSLASQMKPDWLVGVGVSIPLIESSGRSEKVKAAQSVVSQVDSLKSQAKQDLSLLVQKTYLEAQQAIDEVQGLESSIELANENLRLREKAFTQGLSSSLDVVDAQLYVASIETQRSAARFRYLISLTKLLALSSEMNSFEQYQNTAYIPASTSKEVK
ncbi:MULTISPECIES: TolC family protein [Vibrio diabolicus subgroup]|uniref:TolC family protein n=1 Tax=Vibrio diabolicus subgroup TaxID=2315253 RepID=UPI00215EA01C|nr:MULTISPECIES: TolC family protein [Vibrio diabolicus subgroup]MCR9625435.1 TolC family protein [Vibrio antiquarius]MCR9630202.1 TolC family protein [Vibrio antiquarius]MCS0431717.1 TolC family protein [Vibrio diabolicus]